MRIAYPPSFSQCLEPGFFENYPNFEITLDLQSNPSQVVFEGGACEPCQWLPDVDLENFNICMCREACEENHPFWIDSCHANCREQFGGFEYNYNALHECERWCDEEGGQLVLMECQDDCGLLPPAKTISSWVLGATLWYTANLVELGMGTPYDDYVYAIGYNPTSIPKVLRIPTTTNLHGMILSYCIFYELKVNYTDGSCCYFIGYVCYQRG